MTTEKAVDGPALLQMALDRVFVHVCCFSNVFQQGLSYTLVTVADLIP